MTEFDHQAYEGPTPSESRNHNRVIIGATALATILAAGTIGYKIYEHHKEAVRRHVFIDELHTYYPDVHTVKNFHEIHLGSEPSTWIIGSKAVYGERVSGKTCAFVVKAGVQKTYNPYGGILSHYTITPDGPHIDAKATVAYTPGAQLKPDNSFEDNEKTPSSLGGDITNVNLPPYCQPFLDKSMKITIGKQ